MSSHFPARFTHGDSCCDGRPSRRSLCGKSLLGVLCHCLSHSNYLRASFSVCQPSSLPLLFTFLLFYSVFFSLRLTKYIKYHTFETFLYKCFFVLLTLKLVSLLLLLLPCAYFPLAEVPRFQLDTFILDHFLYKLCVVSYALHISSHIAARD